MPPRVIVIRATFFLTVALTLGTNGSAALLCQTFCDRAVPPDAADACRHNQSPAPISLTNSTDCASVGLPETAVIREETNRPTFAVADHALAVSAFDAPPIDAPGNAFATPPTPLTVGNRPRTSILRI